MLTAFRSLANIVSVNARYFARTVAMARFELAKRYSGSLFGYFWALVKPTLFISVYWFAISIGIRGGKPMDGNIPYVLWLLPGILPWFFISDAMTVGGTSIRENKHLVTKMVFPVETIPTFTVISLLIVHLMLLTLGILVFVFSGFGVTIYALQLPYYLFATVAFCLVVATFLSTLTVVSTDIGHLVRSTTTVMFWLSPILWQVNKFTGWTKRVILLNPIAYPVEGYRNCFVEPHWFFHQWKYGLYFWGFLLLLSLLTGYLYAKLRSDFADVL